MLNWQIWTIGLVILSALGFVGFYWQLINFKGYRARGNVSRVRLREKRRRSSDHRPFSKQEKKIYKNAQKLLDEKNFLGASQLLESIGMVREAITVLEANGLINEAAKILMRMKRHNRAGVIYARHGMWSKAAQCFRTANLPLEVARCAREAGELALAAENYEKSEHFEEAAECYFEHGDYLRSARLYASIVKNWRSIELYCKLAEKTGGKNIVGLSDIDYKNLGSFVMEGNLAPALLDLLDSGDKLYELVVHFIKQNKVNEATQLFLRTTKDWGSKLMAEIENRDDLSETLATVFTNVSKPMFAGMTWERANKFEKAAESFSAAEEWERAAYCFERAGKDSAAAEARSKIGAPSTRSKKPSNFDLPPAFESGNQPVVFALEDSQRNVSQITLMVGQPEISRLSNNQPPFPPPPVFSLATKSTDKQDEVSSKQEPLNISNAEIIEKRDGPAGIPSLELFEGSNRGQEGPPPPPKFILDVNPSAPVGGGSNIQTLNFEEKKENVDKARTTFYRAAFLEYLDNSQKDKIWDIGCSKSFRADSIILNYQDEPEGVYVILSGSVNCYRQKGKNEVFLDRMGTTESFGELWLLAEQPTAVKFIAAQDTTLYIISRGKFNDLLDKDGTIARNIYKRFTMRLLKRLLNHQNNKINKEAS